MEEKEEIERVVTGEGDELLEREGGSCYLYEENSNRSSKLFLNKFKRLEKLCKRWRLSLLCFAQSFHFHGWCAISVIAQRWLGC